MSDQAVTAPAAAPNAAEGSSPEGAPGAASDTTPAVKPDAPKQKAPAYRKIKVGDQEVSLSDEDIARDYSKWKGADAKFREAAEARKSVDDFMKALAEDPEKVLSDPRLSINRKKLAEKWLVQQLETELNPPDPRDAKLSEAEKELKKYKDKEAEAAKATEDAETAKVREQRKAALSQTLAEAMKATHLSADPESAAGVLREMAMYMRAAKERGDEVTPQELVAHIHNTRFRQLYTLAHQFEGEQLIEFLGEEIVGRLRKADLARLRAGRAGTQTHKTEPGTSPRASEKRAPRMDAYEARKHAAKVMR